MMMMQHGHRSTYKCCVQQGLCGAQTAALQGCSCTPPTPTPWRPPPNSPSHMCSAVYTTCPRGRQQAVISPTKPTIGIAQSYTCQVHMKAPVSGVAAVSLLNTRLCQHPHINQGPHVAATLLQGWVHPGVLPALSHCRGRVP